MTSKLKFLAKVSLDKKVKNKWFLFANILLLIVIVGLINMDSIISFFGGDFNEKTKIMVLDKTEYNLTDSLKINIKSMNKYLEDMIKTDIKKYEKTEDDLKKELKEDKKSIGIVIEKDDTNIIKVNLITYEYVDQILYQSLVSSLNTVKSEIGLSLTNISQEDLSKIYSTIEVNREFINKDKSNEQEQSEYLMATLFPTFILPFFMLTIFLVQMIGAEVNEEKTTRGMEIIISNVSPQTHFFSKVIAANTFVLIQGLLLIIFGGLGLLIRMIFNNNGLTNEASGFVSDIFNKMTESGIIDKFIYVLPITIILILLSFVLYSLVAGILASMTTNQEDFQQLQTPIILISLVGYYLGTMAIVFKGALFIKIASYIPFLSAILSPTLLIMGDIGIFDGIISILLLLGSIYFLTKYGLRVYKIGILNYSSSKLWTKMFKALKKEHL